MRKASFGDTELVCIEIKKQLHKDPKIGIARNDLIKKVMQKCKCSEYAVMKQIKKFQQSCHIMSRKYGNKIILHKDPYWM